MAASLTSRLWNRWLWDPDQRRLRLVWRLILHAILALVLATVFSLPIACAALIAVPGSFEGVIGEVPLGWSLLLLVPTVVGIGLATLIARRRLDRRSIVSLGLRPGRGAIADVAAGMAIAAAMMGVIFVLELTLGGLPDVSWVPGVRPASGLLLSLGAYFLLFAGVGFEEELLSRGYHLVNLREAIGIWPALLISSLIFSLLHLGNPGAGAGSILGILGAGALLGFARVWSANLWLAAGVHWGWNFFEGNVFGFRVSGLIVPSLVGHTDAGPEWLTGGAFGPEAGAVLLPALLFGLALLRLYTRPASPDLLSPRRSDQ
jgi:hypothetical protein